MQISSAKALGAAIRQARQHAGLTQIALAAKAGISSRTLIAIEAGHPGGELGRVLAVLRALDLAITLTPAPPTDSEPDLLGLAGRDL